MRLGSVIGHLSTYGTRIWWYDYGDPDINPMEKGSYFGRWCVEAVAAVKAFRLDDSRCLGHEHYPGDLVRPNGPSTHTNRYGWKAWLLKQFTGKESRLCGAQ